MRCMWDSCWSCLNSKLHYEYKSYVRRQKDKRIMLVLKTKCVATTLRIKVIKIHEEIFNQIRESKTDTFQRSVIIYFVILFDKFLYI